jgi:hypothetical protein
MTFALVAMLLGACGATARSQPAVPVAPQYPNPDDDLAAVADRVPGFAGSLLAGDTLVLLLVDPAQRAAAEHEARARLGPGAPAIRHVAVRPARYDYRQLPDWRRRVGASWPPGMSALSIGAAENRVDVGVAEASQVARVRRAVAALGVPATALHVTVVRFRRTDRLRPADAGRQRADQPNVALEQPSAVW